jgi:hypothetical protein
MGFWTIAADSSSTERLRITSTGNIGIGTTAPTDKLQVSGNVMANAFNAIGGVAQFNSTGGVYMAGLGGSSYGAIQSYSDAGGTVRTLALNPTGGKVGIGTSSPETRLQVTGGSLWVNGDTEGSLTSAAGKGLRFYYANASDYAAMFAYDYAGSVSKNLVLQSPGGNVGVGSTAPAYKLDVAGNIGLTSGSSIYGHDAGAGITFDSTSAILKFITNSSERMRIDNTGNVGIGTTAPGNKLNVIVSDANTSLAAGVTQEGLRLSNSNSTTNNWNEISFYNSTNSSIAGVLGFQNTDTTNNYGDFAFATRGSGGFGERMRITSTGNVGIGTTGPAFPLDLLNAGVQIGSTGMYQLSGFRNSSGDKQGIELGYDSAGGGVILGATQATGQPIEFWTYNGSAWAERARIDKNGNVGIGTTTPGQLLTVNGNASIGTYLGVGTAPATDRTL